MRGKEIPPAVSVGIVIVIVLIVFYFVWSASGPSMATGGKPNAKDLELLKGMSEAREKSRMGRRSLPEGQTSSGSPSQATGSR